VGGQAAEADSGVAKRAGDFRAQAGLVASFDAQTVHHAAPRQARGKRCLLRLLALDGADDHQASAGLLGCASCEYHFEVDLRAGELLQSARRGDLRAGHIDLQLHFGIVRDADALPLTHELADHPRTCERLARTRWALNRQR